jgi:phage antirepressor YoqD-like protein
MFEMSKSAVTMSSREIAELLEVRHDNVKLSIERLATNGVISFTSMTETSHEGAGARPVLTYAVNKRDSYIVVAQMSPKFTAKLVDRWQELESKQLPALPNYQEALRQLADQLDITHKQTLQLEAQKPAVEFVERYVESSGNKGFREVCKLLKANESRFKEFLTENKIMYRLDGRLMPYGNHLDAGRFEVNAGIADNDHSYTTAKFTPKGINWVAGLWAVHNLEAA